MTFGEHIRTWREERGVGLRRFAKAVGVSPTLNLSRLNHRLPGREAHPEVVEGTTEFHHDIADALFPEADPVFDNATALHATVHVLDPQPTLVQCLVGSVLLQRQLLAAGFLGRHKDLEGVSELWICYPLTEEETHQYGVRGAMITQVLHCPYCQGTDIVRHGTTPEGKQRYRCRACPDRGRTFLLDYAYPGQSQHVKHQIVEMALNASGIRDTARVLRISPTTVIKELKKRNRTCTR